MLLTGERKKVLLTRMGFDRVSPGQNCRLKRSWPVEFRCPPQMAFRYSFFFI